MADWLDRLFNQHKLVRRLTLAWAVWLITYVVLEATQHLTKLTSADVAFISAVIGILATVIGFYQYQRGKDER